MVYGVPTCYMFVQCPHPPYFEHLNTSINIWEHFYLRCPHPIWNILTHFHVRCPHPSMNIWVHFMCGVPSLFWTSEHIFMCGVPTQVWTEHPSTFLCVVSPPYFDYLNTFSFCGKVYIILLIKFWTCLGLAAPLLWLILRADTSCALVGVALN